MFKAGSTGTLGVVTTLSVCGTAGEDIAGDARFSRDSPYCWKVRGYYPENGLSALPQETTRTKGWQAKGTRDFLLARAAAGTTGFPVRAALLPILEQHAHATWYAVVDGKSFAHALNEFRHMFCMQVWILSRLPSMALTNREVILSCAHMTFSSAVLL